MARAHGIAADTLLRGPAGAPPRAAPLLPAGALRLPGGPGCWRCCCTGAGCSIGKQKFSYDLWGDCVNTAARMESHGLPGEIQISEATRQRLGECFRCEARGELEIKGKGLMTTHLLRGRAAPAD